MLGTLETLGTTVPVQPLTKNQFIDRFRSSIREQYGYENIRTGKTFETMDDFMEKNPRFKKLNKIL